ncbi:hypothetical protein F5880DRAFT_1558782 [Lentinula raphanica]|nr:hypothetical protein F5880DRAFT_1558782 [Lentinula raphanica]
MLAQLTALTLFQTLVTPPVLQSIQELPYFTMLILERCQFHRVSSHDIRNLISRLGPRLRTSYCPTLGFLETWAQPFILRYWTSKNCVWIATSTFRVF